MVQQDLRGTHSEMTSGHLLCRGSGEIITVIPGASSCSHWSSVEWLAATTCSATAVVQHGGLCALLHEHQVLNVALRALDGAEIQPAYVEPVGGCVAHGIVQHFAVGSRVTHDTVLANFLAASLKLRLDQADTHGVRRSDRLCHRENMMQRDKRDIHAEKLNGLFQHIRGNIADVRPLHIHHPLVGAQASRPAGRSQHPPHRP